KVSGILEAARARGGDLALLVSRCGTAAFPARRIPIRRGGVLPGWTLAGLHEQRVGNVRTLRYGVPGPGREMADLERRRQYTFTPPLGPGWPGNLLLQRPEAHASRGRDVPVLLGFTPRRGLRGGLWRVL